MSKTENITITKPLSFKGSTEMRDYITEIRTILGVFDGPVIQAYSWHEAQEICQIRHPQAEVVGAYGEKTVTIMF
jgi:hypothetical protein